MLNIFSTEVMPTLYFIVKKIIVVLTKGMILYFLMTLVNDMNYLYCSACGSLDKIEDIFFPRNRKRALEVEEVLRKRRKTENEAISVSRDLVDLSAVGSSIYNEFISPVYSLPATSKLNRIQNSISTTVLLKVETKYGLYLLTSLQL